MKTPKRHIDGSENNEEHPYFFDELMTIIKQDIINTIKEDMEGLPVEEGRYDEEHPGLHI